VISPRSSNGRTESFEKALFKAADRKYRKNKSQFKKDCGIIVELKGLVA
jgi:hypothetical protein